MAFYHVEIGYRTKRGGVCLGMTVKAFGPDEAEEIARKRTLHGYPARKFAFSRIREATASDLRIGVFDETVARNG
jgi:hypothetical protein